MSIRHLLFTRRGLFGTGPALGPTTVTFSSEQVGQVLEALGTRIELIEKNPGEYQPQELPTTVDAFRVLAAAEFAAR